MWVVFLLAGCKARHIVCNPSDLTGCVVDDVEIIGNNAVSDADIEDRIATTATGGTLEAIPVLGAIDTLTVEYQRFDRFVLERDLERVARIYRAKGYYDAVVRAGRVRRIDKHKADSTDLSNVRLLVEILVQEGEPVRVESVTASWLEGEPVAGEARDAALAAKNELAVGSVFTEEVYEKTRTSIQRALTDRGYARAHVEPVADVDIARHKVKVTYKVDTGPPCTFGDVTIIGLGKLPDWQVRPQLRIVKNGPYSTRVLDDAERALNELGVFGAIAIEPDLKSTGTVIPITVRVQPGRLGSVKLGAGAELGDQVALRGVAGWQHKNATGALDRFGIDGRARLVFYPWRLQTIKSDVQPIPEASVRVQYQLPFPTVPDTTLFAQAQVSYGIERNHDPPESLADAAGEIPVEILVEERQGIQRRLFSSRLLLSFSINLLYSSPFVFPFERSSVPGLFISYLDGLAQVDLRRNENGKYDAIHPASGFFGSVDLQVAGPPGDATDVKVEPDLRFYVPLHRKVILAGRFGMGFLYSVDYGFVLGQTVLTKNILRDDVNKHGERARGLLRAAVDRDVGILDKRGLFSGGPASNRGYGFNEIAPQRVVKDDGTRLADPDSVGGRTLWEASVEVRFPIRGSFGGTVFVDASDVTAGVAELRLDHPHLSTGLGLSYDSPIGPLRFDLGFRIPKVQVVGEDVKNCTNNTPDETLWKCTNNLQEEAEPSMLFDAIPAAVSIAIGNAF